MKRRHLATLIKIAVSAGLIWLIFHKIAPDWKKLGNQMAMAFREGYGSLIAALAVEAAVFIVASFRWKIILHGQEVPVSFFRILRLFLIGSFFGQFMPGGLAAGDVIRSYYITCCTIDKKTECVATVVVDRVIGSFGLVTIVLVSLLLLGGQSRSVLIVLGVLVAALLAIVLFFSRGVLTRLPFVSWVNQRLPYRAHFGRVYEAFRHYGEHKGQLVACLGLSVLIQLLLILSAYYVGQSVGVTATPVQYVVGIPLVGAISAIPVSFGNIGTAEAAYFLFFLREGQPEAYRSVVLAFALMMRLLVLFIGFIGGLIWWAEKGTITRDWLRPTASSLGDVSRGDASSPARNTGEER